MKTRFFPCDCSNEILEVKSYPEFDDDGYVWLVFRRRFQNWVPLWKRLRYSWDIVTGREIDLDEVILRSEVARDLAVEILDNVRDEDAHI